MGASSLPALTPRAGWCECAAVALIWQVTERCCPSVFAWLPCLPQGLVGTECGSIWFLNTADPLAEPVRWTSSHTLGVAAVAYHAARDDVFASASADGSLRLWG